MSRGLLFWILMILWFVFGLWFMVGTDRSWQYYPLTNNLLLFVLFVLLGWQCYGAPIKD